VEEGGEAADVNREGRILEFQEGASNNRNANIVRCEFRPGQAGDQYRTWPDLMWRVIRTGVLFPIAAGSLEKILRCGRAVHDRLYQQPSWREVFAQEFHIFFGNRSADDQSSPGGLNLLEIRNNLRNFHPACIFVDLDHVKLFDFQKLVKQKERRGV
jgi:hypothetical protein